MLSGGRAVRRSAVDGEGSRRAWMHVALPLTSESRLRTPRNARLRPDYQRVAGSRMHKILASQRQIVTVAENGGRETGRRLISYRCHPAGRRADDRAHIQIRIADYCALATAIPYTLALRHRTRSCVMCVSDYSGSRGVVVIVVSSQGGTHTNTATVGILIIFIAQLEL